jgi:hypothetical protein
MRVTITEHAIDRFMERWARRPMTREVVKEGLAGLVAQAVPLENERWMSWLNPQILLVIKERDQVRTLVTVLAEEHW